MAEHPFLICNTSEYDTLRERALQSPWKDMAAEAQRIVETLSLDPEANVSARGARIRDLMGALALLYVLEPDQRKTHLSRMAEIFNHWPKFLADVDARWNGPGNRWLATVPPSSAFFNAVLALDVMHDDLDAADRTRYEQSLGDMADWFWAAMRGWGMATFGPRALWAAYRGEDRLNEALKQYRDAVFEQMTKDGVGRNGPEYSHARLNGERTAKYGFIHVAEYTGLDRSFYRDVRLKWFYEWLFSAGCSPFHTYATFGDSGHGRGFNTFYPQSGTWAAGRFSPLAASYAAHRVAGAQPRFPGDLLAYCIAQPLPEARTPESRIWMDGGALFYERNASDEALMGALWNVSAPSHAHRDANAIYLAGYGEHLLLNSGYNGFGNASQGFPWTYIHDTAESSNVLLIGGKNHLEKGADGVLEGLVTSDVEYACGLAARAFESDAQHLRSLIFIHPQDGTPGYFALLDEVENAGDAVSVALHPASADVRTVQDRQEYTWNLRSRKETDTFLTLFLGREPRETMLKDGALAGWGKCIVGKYLYATYQKAPVVTVLFPHDEKHPKAAMARIPGGVRIAHAEGVVDVALSPDDGLGAWEDVMLMGRACLLRRVRGATRFFFARQATHFRDGVVGFESDAPVSLFMRGKTGRVVSPGTTATFYHPEATGVHIDSERFACKKTDGGVRVVVPQGTCAIALI